MAAVSPGTAALLQQQTGKKVIVAEAHHAGFGTTGGTSPHINTFADTTYPEAKSAFGADGAQLFADAVQEGFGIIKNNVNSLNIDCDYEPKQGYLYAENDDEQNSWRNYEGAILVGVAVSYSEDVPTPVAYKKL